MSIDHFAYPIPFNSELREMELIPYRTNTELHRKIDYLFRHVKFEHRKLFIDVSTSGSRQLVSDMSTIAVGIIRHFILYPQKYGHKIDNIYMQILVRMWKQTFKHCKLQERQLDKYYSTKIVLLMIENGLMEELVRTVQKDDFIQDYDEMVTNRDGKGLRESNRASMKEGSKHFEYLASLE